jgi:hypothetical protein
MSGSAPALDKPSAGCWGQRLEADMFAGHRGTEVPLIGHVLRLESKVAFL